MILLPNNEVQLRVRDPRMLTTLIPHAKVNGHLVVVPHKLEETKILRNLGVQVPAPIHSDYDWPCEFPAGPFAHQRETSAFMTLHKRCFVLLDMGLGKSISALWAADWLMQHGMVRKALILSTLSCLDATWYREIFRNMMHRHAIVVHGTKQQRMAAMACDVDFFIMNHHGMLVMHDELPQRKDIDLVIVDEASMLRNGQTQIYKRLKKYLRPDQWLWLLTGKPCPNGPTDAWALARLVSPDRVPQFFTRWKDETMTKVSMFKWVPKVGSTQRMFDAMQPAIRFEKKDCLDLPPVLLQDRTCEMSTLQQNYYHLMKSQLVVYAKEHQVTAVNAAILLGKLLQICAGAVKTDAGEYIGLDLAERFKVLDECVDEAAAKVLVFVPYIGALRLVAEHLKKRHTVEIINGDTTRSQRKDILAAFMDHKDPHIIVAHPKVASHGLNLTVADTIVWFSPIHSLDIYEQANERMARPGQKLKTNIIHIGACPLEWGVYKVLRSKGKAQDEFLELFKQELQS
jgi:SNF2 family DNA or RNA helicase